MSGAPPAAAGPARLRMTVTGLRNALTDSRHVHLHLHRQRRRRARPSRGEDDALDRQGPCDVRRGREGAPVTTNVPQRQPKTGAQLALECSGAKIALLEVVQVGNRQKAMFRTYTLVRAVDLF